MDLSKTQVAMLKRELVKQIIKEMKASGISQGDVGKRIDMSRTNVNMTLKLKTNPSLDQLIRIANSIGLQIELKATKK